MSGHKCSEYRLQREQEEKLRLIQNLNNIHGEIGQLSVHTAAQLKEASEGLRTTFAAEVADAEGWLSELALPDVRQMNMDTDISALNATSGKLGRIVEKGRRVGEALTIAFTQKADELGSRLSRRLAGVEGSYIGHQQLLQLWFGETRTTAVQRSLSDARRLLRDEDYTALEDHLNDVEVDLLDKVKWAETHEDKHQKRLYLLKALRQVCAEWHFKEVSGPRYEQKGERGSRILYTVDTVDRGQITFTLSLDGISSFSEITDDRCFEEFDQLSQYLDEEFGIHTQFRLADGEQPPKRIQKGERDFPHGASLQRGASG